MLPCVRCCKELKWQTELSLRPAWIQSVAASSFSRSICEGSELRAATGISRPRRKSSWMAYDGSPLFVKPSVKHHSRDHRESADSFHGGRYRLISHTAVLQKRIAAITAEFSRMVSGTRMQGRLYPKPALRNFNGIDRELKTPRESNLGLLLPFWVTHGASSIRSLAIH
ncbi:hypothetical protein AFLA_007675 [Aspergillus flavus NRRL3357]|nr:hypothetical protein AFLA_007675 [Aspergillus flavus NRRL3357]